MKVRTPALKLPGMPLSEFLEKLGPDVIEERDGWLAKCPAHGDSHNSLKVSVGQTGKVLVFCRVGCSTKEVMNAVGLLVKDLAAMGTDVQPRVTAGAADKLPEAAELAQLAVKLDGYAAALDTPAGGPALAYAAQRFGIEPDDARRLGLGYATDLGEGSRLVVPFRDEAGQSQGFQARSLHNNAKIRWAGPKNPDGASWAKVGFFPGGSGWPEVIVTEGPGDALTAAATGYDSIGVRGAALASNESVLDTLEAMLDGRVAIVAGDGDAAGRQFSSTLAEGLLARGIAVKVLPMPDGKDLTDWRSDDPSWFRQGFVKKVKELTETTSSQARLGGWDEHIYSLSDVGGARYLRDYLDARGQSIRYTEATGFLQLDNGIWTKRADAQIRTLAHSVGDRLRQFAAAAWEHAQDTKDKSDVDKANRFAFYRDHASSSRGVDALIKELRSVDGVYAKIEDFDKHPYYLAARNGVIDLRTAELLPHDPAFLLTKRVEHDYIRGTFAPRWVQFLHEIFPDQPDMPDYIQRLIGYGITGSTDEQCFVVFYGTGSNGKSILTDTLTEIFRAITTTTPFSTFEQKPSGGIPNDLAALVGARLVMASEGDQGKRMAEAVLKRITGRDKVSARFLNREFFEFQPQFLLIMASNYKPAFMGQDDGLWRRVKLIEFRRQFKVGERDKGLADKLLGESTGILAWAVEGARQWYAGGMQEPDAIAKVTTDYRAQSDVLNGFLPGEWEKTPGEGWVARTELFGSFQDWAEAGNMKDLAGWSNRAFYRAMEERGLVAGAKNGTMGFRGLTKGHGQETVHAEPATMELAPKPTTQQPKSTALKGPSLEGL